MTNKPSDIEGELDKITEKVIYDCGGNIWYDFNDRIKNPGIDEAKAALKALFKREMERIIGANESTQRGQLIYPNRKDRIKNDLRSEQREALDKLISKEE